jgi:indolepyruvate ferredoxin oxidoreductase beta subunit
MALEKDPLNLIITGVGGQGNVLASLIVASAGIKCGLYVTVGETYGASQRGGAVTSHVRFSALEQCGPLIPEGQADVVVGLEPVEALRIIADFGSPRTRVIVSPRPIYPVWVLAGQATYPPVAEVLDKLRELVNRVDVIEATGTAEAGRAANVVMVGALAASGALPIPIDTYEETMREVLTAKDLELNLNAFRKGVVAMNKQGATATRRARGRR